MNKDVQKFADFSSSPLGRKVLELEAGHVRHELKGCQKLLDVGCGIGVFEQYLSDLDITGLDNDEEMLAEARKRNPERKFVRGDIEHLVMGELSAGSFDAVFTVATLEYLENYRDAIREAWKVTKKGGRILAMILNSHSKYVKEHLRNPDSYFRKIKHKNLREIKDTISGFWTIYNERYFVINGNNMERTGIKHEASMYAITAKRKEFEFSPSI